MTYDSEGRQNSRLIAGGLLLILGVLVVEMERETDGRWIAEVVALPGVLAYGANREEALAKAEVLALRVLADRLEHGEAIPEITGLFDAA